MVLLSVEWSSLTEESQVNTSLLRCMSLVLRGQSHDSNQIIFLTLIYLRPPSINNSYYTQSLYSRIEANIKPDR